MKIILILLYVVFQLTHNYAQEYIPTPRTDVTTYRLSFGDFTFRAQYLNEEKKVLTESILYKNQIIFMVRTRKTNGIHYSIDGDCIYDISFRVNDEGIPDAITLSEKTGNIVMILRRENVYMRLASEEELFRTNNKVPVTDLDSIFK